MKRILFFLAFICLEKSLHAQSPRTPYIYTIKADSVKITNTCDTAELIIENHTQTVPGFLFNKGRGRTEFRRGLQKLTDSVYIVGGDTLRMNPWLQGGNRFGTSGSFGTMDNNHIDFYTNSIRRGRLTNKGSLQIGNISWDNEDKLQVGNIGAITITGNLSRTTDRVQIGYAVNPGDGQNVLIRTSSDDGSTYKNVLVERDGYIGLGTSNAVTGWSVGNPALRIYSSGVVGIASSPVYFGNTPGEVNASALVTSISNTNEWRLGPGQIHPRDNYYYFGTRLETPQDDNVRANLRISGKELHLYTGVNETEAMRVTESGSLLIGSTTNYLDSKLYLVGNFVQASPATALFGNTIAFSTWGDAAVIDCYKEVVYKSQNLGDQHLFLNSVGSYFKGTLVTMDPGYYPNMPDTQVALKVRTKFSTQSAPGLTVNMAGNVGIGIETPSAQLHATGTVRFGGLTNDNSLTRIVVSDINGNLAYRNVSSLTAFNGAMNSNLAVNGTVSAQKMLISQTGRWPDYVFSKQYKLPSLSEVEAFINQNSHLPGIPSATEVEKKGIDVANNQAALLKKIEELTLYIIEQEKTIQKQSDQFNELKKEMAELKALILTK